MYWQECGLPRPSTARLSKVEHIDISQFTNKKYGDLHPDDLTKIQLLHMAYINSLE